MVINYRQITMTKKKQQQAYKILPLKGQERLFKLAKEALPTPKGKIPTLADIATAVTIVSNSTEEGLLVHSKEQWEITLSLLFYDVRAKKLHLDNSNFTKLVNSILGLFRHNVSKNGYKKLTLSEVVIAQFFGTLKDKAVLCIQHFDYVRDDGGKRNPVSEKRANNIRASIWAQGDEATEQLKRYLTTYDAYTTITQKLTTVKAMYTTNALSAALYLQNFEWLDRVCNLSDSFEKVLATAHGNAMLSKSQLEELVNLRDRYLMENYTFGSLAYENKGRKDKIDTLQYADEYIIKQAVIPTLSALKGAIMAIKEWAKANDDEDYLLMPYVMKKEIIDPNDTYRIEEINDRFYLSHLKKLEAEGKTITEDDKYISAFPSFDDVEADEEVKETVFKSLNEGYKEKFNQ